MLNEQPPELVERLKFRGNIQDRALCKCLSSYTVINKRFVVDVTLRYGTQTW